jgi:hypothetical protein
LSSARPRLSLLLKRPEATWPSAMTIAPVRVSYVDDGRRLVTLGIGQRVAKDQAAFGVGIQHLDRLPRHAADDVAGLVPAVGHVLAGGHEADQVDLCLELGDCTKRAQNAGCAACRISSDPCRRRA